MLQHLIQFIIDFEPVVSHTHMKCSPVLWDECAEVNLTHKLWRMARALILHLSYTNDLHSPVPNVGCALSVFVNDFPMKTTLTIK